MFFILAESRDGGVTWNDRFDLNRFESGQQAQERAKHYNSFSGSRWRVRKVLDTDDDNYIAREAAKNLVVVTKDNLPDYVYWADYWFPHIDPDNKRNIRYFRTVQDAVTCKYTSMKMSRFFATVCELELEDFESKLLELGFYEGVREFKILRDADEIEAAYENGPRSCMNDPNDYPLGDIHPARAYASPDLGLAVIMCEDDCVARAVVRPDKKIYCTIYGHVSLLKDELKKLGYRKTHAVSAWRGARLLKIYDNYTDAYVCPYLDMSATVSESRDGKYLRMAGRDGKFGAQNCDGFVEG